MIHNPILRGFNPDPSIVRVGDDYYIATSTFEWFPGVQIHHSRDLVHWRLLTHPLTRVSQLDMAGNPDSCGIWAPCLSYCDGRFYLVYTNVRKFTLGYFDGHNYLVTAENIEGPWSEPVYLNSSGFDPSLFHDTDGRKWIVNMIWDCRYPGKFFGGIELQEYSEKEQRLIGQRKYIFKGTPLGGTEGPHLYKRGGYYYLMLAEGGTGYEHSVTIARSRTIDGPYEVDPQNPMLTSFPDPHLELQKAGHASLVETQNGEWYLPHLCGRPQGQQRRCMLGRETAIQKCVWTDDGWLRLVQGGNAPAVEVEAPALPPVTFPSEPDRDDFDGASLSIHFNSLRVPIEESWCSLSERPGFVRLRGRESLQSLYRQSLIARRVQAFQCEAETCVEFEPDHFQQMAGLVCLYGTKHYYYLRITHDDNLGKALGILARDVDKFEILAEDVSIAGWDRVYLRARIDYPRLQFYCCQDGTTWRAFGPKLDASKLSDEYVSRSCFTGAFVGICVQDLGGTRRHADFDYFAYREIAHH